MEQSRDINAIHDCSMRILREIGIRIHCGQSLNILKKGGFRVDGDVVRFDEEKLMRLVGLAPDYIDFYGADSQNDTCVGGDHCEFLPGYGIPLIREAGGRTRYADPGDFTAILKLFEASDLFRFNGLTVHPGALPAEWAGTLMLLDMLRHSQKNLLLPMGSEKELCLMFEILEHWYGPLKEKARVTTIINTLSPLQISRDTLKNLAAFASQGQPLIFTGGVMAGSSGPVTAAGATALGNAESLAAIALAQLIRPNTPVIYGVSIPATDMATGSWALCGPERTKSIAQLSKALAGFYGIPTRNNGCVCDAHGMNIQAGAESMASLMAAQNAGINLHMYSAGTLCSCSVFSYEKFISDLDILSWMRNFEAPVEVSEETLAFDTIKAVGIGGEFLTQPHTFAHCREMWQSGSWVHRQSNPDIDSRQELVRRSRASLEKMFKSHRPPDIDTSAHGQACQMLRERSGGLEYTHFFSEEKELTHVPV